MSFQNKSDIKQNITKLILINDVFFRSSYSKKKSYVVNFRYVKRPYNNLSDNSNKYK